MKKKRLQWPGYTLVFARECLQLGQAAGEIGLYVEYHGRLGSAALQPWSLTKPHGFRKWFESPENVRAFIDGYKSKVCQ